MSKPANNNSQSVWINKSTAIYNHWSFIKCPKQTTHSSSESKGEKEWVNSKQAKCTAYTRATAMKSSFCINTDRWTFFGPTAAPLTLQGSRLDCVSVGRPALLLLWERFDEVVNTEDGDSGLCGHLEALCFDHGGLIDTGLTVVSGLAVDQIQTDPTAQHKKRIQKLSASNQADGTKVRKSRNKHIICCLCVQIIDTSA